MDANPEPRHGLLFWAGATLLVLWNVGLLAAAIASQQEYDSCMADSSFTFCLDLTGPILFVLLASDLVVALIAALVYWRRARRARPPE